MIKHNQVDLLQNGFEHRTSTIEGNNRYLYQGKILSYELIIDESINQVSISGDTALPFSSESMYEIYVPCILIEYKSDLQIDYRNFQFLFYNSSEPCDQSLVLTVSSRKSDGELVVWPYI